MPPRPDDVRYWLSLLQQFNNDHQAVARRSVVVLRLQTQPAPFIPARLPADLALFNVPAGLLRILKQGLEACRNSQDG